MGNVRISEMPEPQRSHTWAMLYSHKWQADFELLLARFPCPFTMQTPAMTFTHDGTAGLTALGEAFKWAVPSSVIIAATSERSAWTL